MINRYAAKYDAMQVKILEQLKRKELKKRGCRNVDDQ